MADLLQFLFKSKFMRKFPNLFSICSINFLLYSIIVSCSKDCSNLDVKNQICEHGICKNNYCECFPGWSGKYCQFCSGRVRLWNDSGVIIDGAGNYSEDNQCTWLIDPNRPNSYVRLYLDHFATECSWDHLYIYDGGSIYDPLLAVFSGMIVQDHYQASRTPEVVAKSGRVLLYFYSDTAYNLTGFSISYRLNGCPSSNAGVECSGHGVCIEGECTCDADWAGIDCTQPLCPSKCFGNGECNMEQHRCLCHSGYTGSDCKQRIEFGWWESFPAPPPSSFEGVLRPSAADDVAYRQLERASHSAVLLGDDEVWLLGGYSFAPKGFIIAINLTDNTLRSVETVSRKKPSVRYGHSSITYNGSIYMYGGTIEDGTESEELWHFDPEKRTWTRVMGEAPLVPASSRQRRDKEKMVHEDKGGEAGEEQERKVKTRGEAGKNQEVRAKGAPTVGNGSCLQPSGGACTPIATVGHSAVLVGNVMLVIFGYSSTYGALNLVQEFHFEYQRWKIIRTEGAVVRGTFGHSSVWHPDTRLVFVHGGLQSAASNQVVDTLLAYDPFKHQWSVKRAAPLPRFLHTSSLISGLMFVFGGNTHNDTAFSHGAKCFSADFLVYDIHCDTWHHLNTPPNLRTDAARYGHATVSAGFRIVVLGGFNGRMLGTALHYHAGKCDAFTSKMKCLLGYPGRKCIWNRVLERCEVLVHQDKTAHDLCSPQNEEDRTLNYTSLCAQQNSCHSCLHNSFGCVWCSSGCFYEKCTDYTKGIVQAESCEDRRRWWCKSLQSCNLCHAHETSCNWLSKECVFAPNQTIVSGVDGGTGGTPTVEVDTTVTKDVEVVPPLQVGTMANASSFALQNALHTCSITCSQRNSCSNCTQGPCMWCFNQQRCVNNNSYLISFPYGQCREWTTEARRCPHLDKGASRCMVHQTCRKCQSDIACGWCDDSTRTGTGLCLEGGQMGPVNTATGQLEPTKCLEPQWFFTSCPACNCNGHSHCVNHTTCIQPCANNTKGLNCQTCKDSFFGRPINGGLCKPCHCNEHGVTCEHDTGVCHCHTKGVTGDHCERCDTQNNYYGEPLKGSCFYDLQIDYQFTFNLSKQEDIHIRQINFYNVPTKSDVDTDFDIQCSKGARIKISAKQTGGHETWIVKNFTGMSIKRRFSASEYAFGAAENNTTFHVYVFNFTPPIEIIISFSQHPKLDLIQFFSIFSLCFMVLLLMAFVMWKIKQKYDLYTRRQRLMVEMEAMASRPFRAIFLELQLDPSQESATKNRKANGTPVVEGHEIAVSRPDATPAERGTPPVLFQALTKKVKGKTKSKKKNSNSSAAFTESHATSNATVAPPAGLTSNGVVVVVTRNACNGSVATAANIHPQISLQIPETKLIKNKNNPSPISLEPCAGNRAAILSLLVQLPTGDTRYTSPGHPGGLAVASTLVSLGPPRKSSLVETCLSSERELTKAVKGPKSLARITHDPTFN